MEEFDYKKFLVENKLTLNSRLEEAASENLELKSIAKKMYTGFKQNGAKVRFAKSDGEYKLIGTKKDEGRENVSIYVDNDSISVSINSAGIGEEKARDFYNQIKKSFPKFKFIDMQDGKTWEGDIIVNFQVKPGTTTS